MAGPSVNNPAGGRDLARSQPAGRVQFRHPSNTQWSLTILFRSISYRNTLTPGWQGRALIKSTPGAVFPRGAACRVGQFRHPNDRASSLKNNILIFYRNILTARMAELVDALVSNTSGSNAVPVRSRLRVLKKSESESESEHSRLFFLTLTLTLTFFPALTLTLTLNARMAGPSVKKLPGGLILARSRPAGLRRRAGLKHQW